MGELKISRVIAIGVVIGIVAIILQNRTGLITKALKFIFVHEKRVYYDSPSLITSIKQIDELITAEYCGEAYCSFKILQETMIDTSWNGHERELRILFDKLKSELGELSKQVGQIEQRKRIFEKNQDYAVLRNDINFGELLKCSNKKNKAMQLEEIRVVPWNTFKGAKFREYREGYKKNLRTRTDLIYIARGCVQVGINLSDIIGHSETVEGGEKMIIDSLKFNIMNVNVNPWFVPKKIPGFEVWTSEDAKSISFDEMNQVKSLCKESLEKDAISSGIFLKAVDNLKPILTSFVSSIQSEVKDIDIRYSFSDLYFEMVTADHHITKFETETLLDEIRQFKGGTRDEPANRTIAAYRVIVAQIKEYCEFEDNCYKIPTIFNYTIYQMLHLIK